MVNNIDKVKEIHCEFINWLKTKKDIPNISQYIDYTVSKLNLYEEYEKTNNIQLIKNLTSSLNRYRDEFNFEYKTITETYSFFERMDSIINNIENV